MQFQQQEGLLSHGQQVLPGGLRRGRMKTSYDQLNINEKPPTRGERGERLRWSRESGPVQRGAILISASPLVYGLVAVGRAESVEEALKGDRLKILR